MNKPERRQILARFVTLFGDLPVKQQAEMLGVNQRTARRIQGEENIPTPTLASRMKELSDEALGYAKMSEDERTAALDQERARRERRQRKIAPDFRADRVRKNHPPFMRTAYARLLEGEYQTVIDILIDRVEDEAEWQRIPEIVKPYVLETLGFAYHYTGRPTEAIDAYRRALYVMGNNPQFLQMRQGCWSMIASVHLSLRQFEAGFEAISEGIEISREFNPLYYHALCLAVGTRDPQRLAQWIGRTLEAAETSWTADDLAKFIKRCENDDADLDWAKQQPVWRELIAGLKSTLKVKGS